MGEEGANEGFVTLETSQSRPEVHGVLERQRSSCHMTSGDISAHVAVLPRQEPQV